MTGDSYHGIKKCTSLAVKNFTLTSSLLSHVIKRCLNKNCEEDTTAEITFLVTVCYLCINNHDDRYDSISSDNIFRRQLCFGHDIYQKVERASIGFQIKRKIMDSHWVSLVTYMHMLRIYYRTERGRLHNMSLLQNGTASSYTRSWWGVNGAAANSGNVKRR